MRGTTCAAPTSALPAQPPEPPRSARVGVVLQCPPRSTPGQRAQEEGERMGALRAPHFGSSPDCPSFPVSGLRPTCASHRVCQGISGRGARLHRKVVLCTLCTLIAMKDLFLEATRYKYLFSSRSGIPSENMSKMLQTCLVCNLLGICFVYIFYVYLCILSIYRSNEHYGYYVLKSIFRNTCITEIDMV